MKTLDNYNIFSVFVFLMIWLYISTIFFIQSANEIEFEERTEQLCITARNNVGIIDLFFQESIRLLEMGAKSLENTHGKFTNEEIIKILEDLKKTGGFLSVSINSENGFSFDSEQQRLPLHKNYIEKMKNHEIIVSDIFFDKAHQTEVISISVPLKIKNNEDFFYLNGDFSLEKISAIFQKIFFYEDMYFHVFDSNMECIVSAQDKEDRIMQIPLSDAIKTLQFEEEGMTEKLLLSFETLEENFCSYTDNNKTKRYLYYLPVGINNWMYWLLVPQTVLKEEVALHSSNSIQYLISVASILIIMFVLIIVKVVEANDNSKTMQRAVALFATQTKKIIFEWHWEEDTGKKIIDFTGCKTDKDYDLLHKNIFKSIYHEDIGRMQDAFDKILTGEDITNMIVRLMQKNNKYMWYSFSTASLKTKKGNILKIYAFLENIDDSTRHTAELKKKNEVDPLTKVYNKIATEKLITSLLSEDGLKKGALFFVDLDNFKPVNDVLGHTKGDEVLLTVTTTLKSIFRQNDIIGRFGGDEFIVYMSDYENIDIVYLKAQRICDDLKRVYSCEANSVELTASVGVSFFPEHGHSFEDLVICADKALYDVKRNSKNRYKIYSINEK